MTHCRTLPLGHWSAHGGGDVNPRRRGSPEKHLLTLLFRLLLGLLLAVLVLRLVAGMAIAAAARAILMAFMQ